MMSRDDTTAWNHAHTITLYMVNIVTGCGDLRDVSLRDHDGLNPDERGPGEPSRWYINS